MATNRVITCKSCSSKISGQDSFDEIALMAGWKKEGSFYICPNHSGGIKPAEPSERVSRSYPKPVKDSENPVDFEDKSK